MPNNIPGNDELSGIAREIMQELKTTGGLVIDAAKLGKDELLDYVTESIRANWISPSQAQRSHYSEAFKKEQQAFAEQRAARKAAAEAAVSKPRAKRSAKIRQVGKNAGFLLTGGCLWVGLGLIGMLAASGSLALALITAAPGVFPLLKGRKLKNQETLYEKYRSAVGSAGRMRLETVAARSGRSYGEAVKDITDMVDRGYFGPYAEFDAARGVLIVDPSSEELAEDTPAAVQEAEPVRGESYEALLLELRLLSERIEDKEMTDRIYRIEAVAKATFLAVQEKPEKRAQIQRFMDYYLPTTIKLLDAYSELEKQPVEGENIRSSKKKIEGMTVTLSEAFEKQFDSLFKAESMDINTEIRAMDSLLRQDGFVGGLKVPAAPGAPAASSSSSYVPNLTLNRSK